MTAWAHWSWTSGRTSPSSPIRPASESEQPPAAATGRMQAAAITAGGFFFFFSTFYFAFLVCVPILHLLPPFPVFPSALCQTHLSGPSGPASRILSCAQTRIGETLHCMPQDQAFGQLGRFWSLINRSPWQSQSVEPWGLPEFLTGAPTAACLCVAAPARGCLLVATRWTAPCATFLALSGGSERPRSPAPFSVRKAVKSRGLGGEEAPPRGSRAQDSVSGSP